MERNVIGFGHEKQSILQDEEKNQIISLILYEIHLMALFWRLTLVFVLKLLQLITSLKLKSN